jgi:hypothetical protein
MLCCSSHSSQDIVIYPLCNKIIQSNSIILIDYPHANKASYYLNWTNDLQVPIEFLQKFPLFFFALSVSEFIFCELLNFSDKWNAIIKFILLSSQ